MPVEGFPPHQIHPPRCNQAIGATWLQMASQPEKLGVSHLGFGNFLIFAFCLEWCVPLRASMEGAEELGLLGRQSSTL